MLAVMLTGGGARGAFQVGVLKAVSEMLKEAGEPFSADIWSGMSAGSINATHMASFSDDLGDGISRLEQLWSGLRASSIYRHDFASMGKIGFGWLTDATFGSLVKRKKANFLLDNSPLEGLLQREMDLERLARNLEKGCCKHLVVTAFDYVKAQTVHYVQSHSPVLGWQKRHQRSQKDNISCDHIMASCAIPIVFPARKLENEASFGDGSFRNTVPLSPLLQLGADEILLVGVQNPEHMRERKEVLQKPSIARMFGLILNSLFFDSLEVDHRRLQDLNRIEESLLGRSKVEGGLRKVDSIYVQPSVDLGAIAVEHIKELPSTVHYLLRGLGSNEEAAEVASYLLFESAYTEKLMEIGYDDAMRCREKILELFSRRVDQS